MSKAYKRAIQIHAADNVGVALADLKKGDLVLNTTLIQDVPKGHKFSLSKIENGSQIIKYASPIGYATAEIRPGEHVHIHNTKTTLEDLLAYQYTPAAKSIVENSKAPLCFQGYLREDGRAAIRNEIWVVNTVGCVNPVAQRIVSIANKRFSGKTDGIFTFTHPYGCSQMGDDQVNTQKILARLADHPNAGGVLVLGLGCENNNIPEFKKVLGAYNDRRIKFLSTQDEEDEIEAALGLIEDLVEYAAGFQRQSIPVSKLVIGLKCGGSDGLSGITANPLVGRISDEIISMGGTTILTEVPEMFGAEQWLMNRCANKDIFEKTVSLINRFKSYYISHNQVVYDNPSPGNKAGGITTLEDKSLGCIQKGGLANVVDVKSYGEAVETHGLNLLESPGNDIVANTALVAAGAHIILFTTGRGTPIGAPVPTVKIATNSDLALHKKNWIDINAGRIVTDSSFEEVTKASLSYIIDVASGKQRTKNEENDYRDIAIFKNGVTL